MTEKSLREALKDFTPGIDRAVKLVTIDQVDQLAEFFLRKIGTPAAKWREEGKPDPHGASYDCERAGLTKGGLTDDELANGIFMVGRNSLDLIVWQDAAKERILWLSRKLVAARADALREAAEALTLGKTLTGLQADILALIDKEPK